MVNLQQELQYAKGEDYSKHRELINNPDTSAEVLIELAKNPNILTESYRALLFNPDVNVRVTLLKNVNTPPDVLIEAEERGYPEERLAIAGNISTPEHLIQALLNDPDPKVAKAAQELIELRPPVTKAKRTISIYKNHRLTNPPKKDITR